MLQRNRLNSFQGKYPGIKADILKEKKKKKERKKKEEDWVW